MKDTASYFVQVWKWIVASIICQYQKSFTQKLNLYIGCIENRVKDIMAKSVNACTCKTNQQDNEEANITIKNVGLPKL